jgi:aminoglycoside phosphotransferase
MLGLYDLSKDPWERKNLLEQFPEKAAELRRLHEQFIASCPPSIARPEKGNP